MRRIERGFFGTRQTHQSSRKQVKGIDPLHTQWKPIWDSIRAIGSSFKGTRYPSLAEKDQAWQRFQKLVEKVKATQNIGQKQREKLGDTSEHLKSKIVSLAYAATPPSGWEESIYAITFGLLEGVIRGAVNALLPGPEVDETKIMLMRCSEKLKDGWDFLSEHKTEMIGRHKKEAFEALTDAQTKLNAAWERWKGAQQRAWEAKQRAWEAHRGEKREKRDTFERRVESNIEKLGERMERLASVLRHKVSHLDELQEKRCSARSDEFRDRVDSWIEEEENAIREIRSKIEDIEKWKEEERAKLR